MYLCISVFTSQYMHRYIHICIYIPIHIYIYIHIEIKYIRVCISIYIYIFIIWREICITHIISYQYDISGIIYHTSAYIHNICLYIYTFKNKNKRGYTSYTYYSIYICVFLSTYISYTSSIEPHIPKSKWSWPQDFAMFAHSKHWTGSK